MKRSAHTLLTLALGGAVSMSSPAWAAMENDDSRYPARYDDHYEITARGGMLVGGEGRTGNAMQYRGEHVWAGPGTATVLVRERNNSGIVMGNVRAKGHIYTVLMDQFSGNRPFQGGGIAKSVTLHGDTRRGAPIFPEIYAYLAGWGRPCTVWKDTEVLHADFECHFMLTEAVRDPKTGEIAGFPREKEVREVLRRGQGRQGDSKREQQIREQIRKSGGVEGQGLQLHVIAHSPKRDVSNLPPYEAVMHFVWNEVEWRGGPERPAYHNRPVGWTDQEIARMIRQGLNSNHMVDARDISVKVKDGRVVLEGTTDNAFEKHHAFFSAWVPGVTSVRNNIQVDWRVPVSDRGLRQAITHAYSLNPLIDHRRPEVQVKEGVVTLKGIVRSRSAKRAAEDMAWQFEGVEAVNNQLMTDESLRKRERSNFDARERDIDLIRPAVSEADFDLEQDIHSELTWSPYVDADRVAVTVRDGVAYLLGTVEDRAEMRAAIRNAYEAGADRVENHMITEPDMAG